MQSTNGKDADWRLLWRLIRIVKEDSRALYGVLALIPIGIGANLLQPYLLKLTIDTAIVGPNPSELLKLCTVFLVVVLLGYVTSTLGEYGLQVIGMTTLKRLRERIFRHVMQQGQGFFDKRTTGALMTRTTNDVEAIYESIAWGGIGRVTDAFAIIATVIIMLALDWRLTIVAFIFSPVIVFVVNLFRRNIRRLFTEIRELLSELNGYFAEQIHGMTELQLHGGRIAAKHRFDAKAGSYLKLYKTANWWDAGLYSIMDGMSALAVGLMIIAASYLMGVGDVGVTLGLIVAFVDYLTKVFVPIREFSGKFASIQRALTALERIFELIDTQEQIREGSTELEIGEHDLVFEDVSFRYREDTSYAVKDISFRVNPGEVVALVGETGSGKTTLGKLLLRRYEHFEGNILVGGHPIQKLTGMSLKQSISMVHQDPYIFDGSIEDNIRLWSKSVKRDALLRAVRASKIDALLEGSDKTLNYHVSERGRNLSAGERQLISIARAFARPSPVVILDEATANVDSATEKLIDDALTSLFKQKTMIVIAHRLSTIMKADRIVVLKQGRLIEQGTHFELCAGTLCPAIAGTLIVGGRGG